MSGVKSQRKGKALEEALANLIGRLLVKAGCEIVEGPRIEPVGRQHGRDIVVRFRYPFAAHIWTVVFECKNKSKGMLCMGDFAAKPYQISVAGLDVDAWVLVAPHVRLAAEAYNHLQQLQLQFTFNLSVLTPEQKVEDFFALEPDLYELIYGQKTDIPSDSAYWQKQLLKILDNLGYLQRIVSNSMPTMEVVHPGEIEKKRVSNKKNLQKLAQEFYRGQIPEWKHIASDLDFRRFEASEKLAELRQVAQDQGGVHLILALSEAGTGKSTFLMREALEAARAGTIVLYGGGLPHENLVTALVTTVRSIQDRAGNNPLLLVLDNAASIAEELRKLLLRFYTDGQSLIVLAADRFNRWCDAIGEQPLEEGTIARFPGKIHFLTLSQLGDREQKEFVSKIRQLSISPQVMESNDEELISRLEHNYKGQLVVFLLELLEGTHFEAIVRDEAADFEKKHPSMGNLYRATAAFHQFGINIAEGVIQRFLNVTVGLEKQHFRHILQAALDGNLLRVDQFSQLSTRHEIIAQALFEGLNSKAQQELLVDLIAAIDPNKESEVSALTTILVDSSRRSDIWAKPYRRALYKAALAKFPDHPRLRDNAALLYIHEGDLETAYEIVMEQKSVTSLQNLARAELKRGHWDIAHSLYCEALDLPVNLSDEELLVLAKPDGEIEHKLKEEKTDNIAVTEFARFLSSHKLHIAIEFLQCLIRSGKEDAYSIHLLARCLKKVGRIHEAVKLLNEGRKRFPESASVFSLDLINLMKDEKKNEHKIETAYQEAIEHGWADAFIYSSYARFVKKNKGGKASIDIFSAGIKAAADPYLCTQFASLLKELGRDKKAEEILRQGIKMFPLSGWMYTELGRLLKQKEQNEDVANIFLTGLHLCPTSPHLYIEYALLLEEQGKLDLAEEVFRDGIKAAPLNGPIYSAFAGFLEKQDKDREAEEVLRKGVEQAFIVPEGILHRLAYFLDSHGRQSEAEKFYKLGLKRFPRSPYFYVSYGLLLQNRKRFRAALHCYQRGMKNTENKDAPLAQVLGRLLNKMWRDEEAIATFKTGLKADYKHATIYNDWTRLHWYRGQLKQAEQVANRGIVACPGDKILHISLAIVLRSQGKSELADKHLSKAMSLTVNEVEKQHVLKTFNNPIRRMNLKPFKIVETDVKGRIKSVKLNHPNPFGFVTAEDRNDYYFPLLKGAVAKSYPVGKLCEFDLVKYPNGKRQASYVEVME